MSLTNFRLKLMIFKGVIQFYFLLLFFRLNVDPSCSHIDLNFFILLLNGLKSYPSNNFNSCFLPLKIPLKYLVKIENNSPKMVPLI